MLNMEVEVDPKICKACYFARRLGPRGETILGCKFLGDFFPSGVLYSYELLALAEAIMNSHGKLPSFECPKGICGIEVPVVIKLF